MKYLFIMILILAGSASNLSCGNTGQNTGSLGSMLSSIPSEQAANSIVWFYNMEKIKTLAGVAADTDCNEFYQATEGELQRRNDLMAAYTVSPFSGQEHLSTWHDTFGFDAFDINQEIWIENVIQPNGGHPSFSVMNGNFDENNIKGKFTSLGHQIDDFACGDYCAIRTENQIDLKSSEASGMSMACLNRMMVKQHEIIAAPAEDVLFSVMDVRSAKQNSLQDSLAYTRVAEILGDSLGAALIPQSVLQSENSGLNWDKLHTYDLAGIGYRVDGKDRKIVIVLHYPDNSASLDFDELSQRLSEYSLSFGQLENPYLSDVFNIGNPKAIIYDADSILQVELKYKANTSRALVWSSLEQMQNLGFLVVDPEQ